MLRYIIALLLSSSQSKFVNFEDAGGVHSDASNQTQWLNGDLMNTTLNALESGDTLVIPNKTFSVMGGIWSHGLNNVTIQLDGTLSFSDNIKEWPTSDGTSVLECIRFSDASNVTFTSSGVGTFEGNGAKWWGFPFIGYLERVENRPRLFKLDSPKDVIFENLLLHNSPYWTFTADGADGLEIRNSHIDARRTKLDHHDLIDISAFNTDGFDVSGNNVWIHDCTVWNQDDCFDVKGGQNMLIENVEASGFGLTIGSIGAGTVQNITFRNAYMHHTKKGIYMKFRGDGGTIKDITYENIVMDAPEQYAIWIGPAQQSDSRDLCAAHPCSLCWPEVPFSKCNAANSLYENILLKNITVNNAKQSPGVILATEQVPMKNVTFQDVKFTNPGKRPFGSEYYKCENVGGVATGDTWPVPPCFEDRTTDTLKQISKENELTFLQ